MRITVSVTNDLLTDQRVHKVCSTLVKNGYEIMLIGRRLTNEEVPNRGYKTRRMRLLFRSTFLFYAEYNIRLFFYLLNAKTDAFLANDTDTLPANFFAAFLRRKPLIFDAHEMFPEVPEVYNRKIVKWVWTMIENIFFPHLENAYTVCQSIADYYNSRYSINMQVIRNIPVPFTQNRFERPIQAPGKRILLYQGAVNEGRGIEYIIDAMPFLRNCVFYVVGDGDILELLKQKVEDMQLQSKVIFVGRIPFEQLGAYTRCANIGINILENKGLSYYYSLPNRFFDYLQANIPSLSSNFPEMRKMYSKYEGIGMLAQNNEPEYLAETIRQMLLRTWSKRAFDIANKELTWENEAAKLLNIVQFALGKDRYLEEDD